MEARWQWVEEWVGGEAPNIENSQQLGTEGEEPCPGHRHSGGLVDDHDPAELEVDRRGVWRGSSWWFRSPGGGRTWSKGSEGRGWCRTGWVWHWWQQSLLGAMWSVGLLSANYIIYLTKGSSPWGLEVTSRCLLPKDIQNTVFKTLENSELESCGSWICPGVTVTRRPSETDSRDSSQTLWSGTSVDQTEKSVFVIINYLSWWSLGSLSQEMFGN